MPYGSVKGHIRYLKKVGTIQRLHGKYQYQKDTKDCIKCGVPLEVGKNILKSSLNAQSYVCNECRHARQATYRKTRKASIKSRDANRGWARKLKAFQIISNEEIPRCVWCRTSDLRILTIHHKHKKPKEDKKLNSSQIYQKIISGKRATNDLEVRCQNCNILYEYIKGKLQMPKQYEKYCEFGATISTYLNMSKVRKGDIS